MIVKGKCNGQEVVVETDQFDVGITVGRFQVSSLHGAHKALLDRVCNVHRHAMIFIGVAPTKGTRHDPLDFLTRYHMLKDVYPHALIQSLHCMPCDEAWSAKLDARVREAFPTQRICLYTGRDGFKDRYHGEFTVVEVEKIGTYTGTQQRLEDARELPRTKDARAAAIYAIYNQYPKVYPTVDVAIFNKGDILLGRKPDIKGLQFIGGFVDPTDDSLEGAVRREVIEECGISLSIDDVRYVGSMRQSYDWRYRGQPEQIITNLFVATRIYGPWKMNNEWTNLDFWPLDKLTVDDFAEVHKALFVMLQVYLKKIDNLNDALQNV